MNCRHCSQHLNLNFIDLGTAPPSNAYVKKSQLNLPEKWYPLKVLVCENCWLVQTEDIASAGELFDSEYAYFSSFSKSWLAHAQSYVQKMKSRFDLGSTSFVIEVAANDGYLLQYVKASGISCLGVEPTRSTAAAAREKGITIEEVFFGVESSRAIVASHGQADLTAANNVLAHVPFINDFVSGFREILKPNGVSTFEFPHLLNLVKENQFDTIYHEHFSYLSLTAVKAVFEKNGLSIFDVEELPTHGGSLRVYAQKKESGRHVVTSAVEKMLVLESEHGISRRDFYENFQIRAEKIKFELLRFLLDANKSGKKVAAYGAAAKGNTLLNFSGVRADLINCVADANPNKQGQFLPGSRIPIVTPEELLRYQPDYVIILPWNLKQEIMGSLQAIKQWNGKFVTFIPGLEIT